MKIFKFNLKRILKNKTRLAILIIVPIMFISVFVLGAFNTVTVGICDEDNSELTKYIVSDLKKNKFYHVKMMKSNELLVNTLDYNIDYAIHFNKGFEEDFFKNDLLQVKEYYFEENEYVMNVKTYIQSYINNLDKIKNSTNTKVAFYQVLEDYESGQLKVSKAFDDTAGMDQAIFSIGFTIYFLIFLSVITCGLIIEDRNNGTLQRIFNSPISLRKYLFESLLSFMVIGFLQVFCLLFIFKFIFRFQYGPNFINLFILVFTFSIVSITMGLLIVSIVKSPIQAYLIVGILASPLSMLGGCYWPNYMMPDWLQNVSQFLPTTWVMKGANELIVDQENFIDILDNIGILILFGILFFVGGIFKRTDFAKS
ncbi:ABC transporter permease [Mycoplasmatota bacterium]|nr:ABC transporter permease [Mycoplasmatota bacterium]